MDPPSISVQFLIIAQVQSSAFSLCAEVLVPDLYPVLDQGNIAENVKLYVFLF